MNCEIHIQPGIAGFAEDKDQARSLRINDLLPALERNNQIIIDFKDVKYATQSFIHALIGEPLKKYGERLLENIEFRNCSPQLRSVIALVVDYSIGGFKRDEKSVPNRPTSLDAKRQ